MNSVATGGGVAGVLSYAGALALLVVPGVLIARPLRASAPLVAGVVLSLLLLFQGVFWLNLAHVPITFVSMLAWQAAWSLIAAMVLWRRRERPTTDPGAAPKIPADVFRWLPGALVVVTGVVLGVRTSLVPLTGPDNPGRFDLLAVRLIDQRGLWFYPPVTDAQFEQYGFPESIPPMVSVVYAWLYAAWGDHRPALTAGFTVLQWAALACVAGRLARLPQAPDPLDRRTGAIGSLLVACCPLVLFSLILGQEAGVMALAAGAMLYFLLDRSSETSTAVLAGAAAALAAVTREYGVGYAALGAALGLYERRSLRWVGTFLAVVVLMGAPWYVRSWILTGSPVYSVPIGGLFAENPVVADFYRSVRGQQGVTQLAGWQWQTIGRLLLEMAPVHVTLGLVAALVLFRRRPTIVLAAVALVLLWLASIGMSHSLLIWLRTLAAPAVLVSALLAPTVSRWFSRRGAGPLVVLGVLIVSWAYSTLFAWVYPRRLSDVPPAEWPAAGFGRQTRHWDWQDLPTAAAKTLPPDARVLTTDVNAHSVLHGTGHEGVAVWQPSVQFLFDPTIDAAEATRRLSRLKITAVYFVRGDLWDPYLRRRSPFYAGLGRDGSPWRPVATLGSTVLYALPGGAEPQTPSR